MEEVIGGSLIVIVAILSRGYIIDNPILQNSTANQALATAATLTLLTAGLIIMLGE